MAQDKSKNLPAFHGKKLTKASAANLSTRVDATQDKPIKPAMRFIDDKEENDAKIQKSVDAAQDKLWPYTLIIRNKKYNLKSDTADFTNIIAMSVIMKFRKERIEYQIDDDVLREFAHRGIIKSDIKDVGGAALDKPTAQDLVKPLDKNGKQAVETALKEAAVDQSNMANSPQLDKALREKVCDLLTGFFGEPEYNGFADKDWGFAADELVKLVEQAETVARIDELEKALKLKNKVDVAGVLLTHDAIGDPSHSDCINATILMKRINELTAEIEKQEY